MSVRSGGKLDGGGYGLRFVERRRGSDERNMAFLVLHVTSGMTLEKGWLALITSGCLFVKRKYRGAAR